MCDVCGMTFKSQTGLRYHSFSHEEEDMRHKCKICDKVFGWKNQLMVKKNENLEYSVYPWYSKEDYSIYSCYSKGETDSVL